MLKGKATEAAASALFQGLGWLVTSVVLPYLTSRYGSGWLGRSLTVSVGLPSWVLVSFSLFVVGAAMIVWVDLRRREREARALRSEVAALRAEIERRDRRAATFPWGGVEWPLTENFWGIVLRTSADAFATGGASPNLLEGAVGDPLCANPQCRREVWPCVATGRCGECGSTFGLGLARMENVPATVRLDLKRRVYGAARAAYLRQQEGPLKAGPEQARTPTP